MHRAAAALALLASLAAPVPARATWSESGMVVDDYIGSRGVRAVSTLRAENGDVFLLAAGLGNAFGYETQRILPSGEIAPGWGTGAVYLGTVSNENFHSHAIAPDGSGGLFHLGYFDCSTPDSIGLQHVRPDGVLEPSGSHGTCGQNFWRIAATASLEGMDAASDGAGGVYVAWSGGSKGLRLQRRLVDGSLAAGWSAFGRYSAPLPANFVAPDVEPDGASGAVIFWTDTRPRAIRILPDTTLATGWSAGGLLLGATAPDIGTVPSRDLPKLLPSGPDHWIAVWRETPSTGVVRVVAQRFGSDGTLDPAWPAAGLEAVAPAENVASTTAISDGQGGVHVLWESGGYPAWTHVLATGAFAPGHTSAGRSPIYAGADYAAAAFGLISGAAANDGGLVFVWGSAAGVRAHWLLSNGSPDPAEPPTGRLIPLNTTNGLRTALPDGLGGVIAIWQFWNSAFDSDLLAGRLLRTGLVDVPAAPATRVLTLRAPAPSPARGGFDVRFVLPDDAPAQLELFDVSGRRLRALDVKGAGEGSARFERLGELRAGVYLVRLSRGVDQRWARVAIVP